MGRPDGRIEKGQSLNRAISARAWNRAQDAADVVLGVRPGFEAEANPLRNVQYMTFVFQKASVDAQTNDWPGHLAADASGNKLRVGFAVGISDELLLRDQQIQKASLADLDTLSTENLFINTGAPFSKFGYNANRFGVITNVSVAPPEGILPSRYVVTAAIGGVFVCRCLAFALGDALVGPVTPPADQAFYNLWYPYPITSPIGTAQVLAYGNYVRLTANDWPRIYEVLVKM